MPKSSIKGDVPPEVLRIILPLFSPKQRTFVIIGLTEIGRGDRIFTLSLILHPLESITDR